MNSRPLLPFLLIPLLFIQDSLAQGSLTPPPGPPAPTMKTLAQIEPRTPVDAANTPGDAANDFIISQPGSYFLQGNLTITKTTGIRITAERVFLDLGGFEMKSAVPGSSIGIVVSGHSCSISRGSLHSFLTGMSGLFASGGRVSGLNVTTGSDAGGVFAGGIFAGSGWTVTDCTLRKVSGTALFAGPGTTASHCAATECASIAVISLDAGASLSFSSVYNATATYGIYASDGGTISSCSVSSGTCNNAIFAGDGVTLRDCAVRSLGMAGAAILTGNGCNLTNGIASKCSSGLGGCASIQTGPANVLTGCTVMETIVTGEP